MRSFPALGLLLALPAFVFAQDKGTEVKINGMKAAAPADWKKEKPANLLRSYQFKLSGEGKATDAELTVYPESHPNPDKSFPRWKATFVPPEGKTIDDIAKASKWDVKNATVNVLDVSGGTWKYKAAPNDPKSKEMLLDNYRVVWVIVADKDEATHIRMSGPMTSVDAQFEAFEKWVKSLR